VVSLCKRFELQEMSQHYDYTISHLTKGGDLRSQHFI
jgi:hypothetical protein